MVAKPNRARCMVSDRTLRTLHVRFLRREVLYIARSIPHLQRVEVWMDTEQGSRKNGSCSLFHAYLAGVLFDWGKTHCGMTLM